MRKNICLFVVIITILVTGCEKFEDNTRSNVTRPGQSQDKLQNEGFEHTSGENGKLTIWSFYDLDEEIYQLIRTQLPSIELDYKVISIFELTKAYEKAYDKGELPDIFMFDPIVMGTFSSTNAFVNLTESPYKAESMLNGYPEHLKSVFRSYDGEKLIAMPVEINPYVTFYRYDIMKEYGFPAEPLELALYMENEENWLNIIKTFKSHDLNAVNWSFDPLLISDMSYNLFDPQFNYMRNSEVFIKKMELVRTIDSLGLAANFNLLELGKDNPLYNDKLVMFQSSFKYVDALKEATKDKLSGNWRMTQLPFGLYSWAFSVVAAIPIQSNNKENAWKVVELLTSRHLTQMSHIMESEGKAHFYNDSFFGDQNVDIMYKKLIEEMPRYNITPLDEKARTIWWTEWGNSFFDRSISEEAIINKCSKAVLEEIDKDIVVLKTYKRK